MKTTYHWLREYCPVDWPPEDLARRLSMAGCLVEEVEPVGDDYVFAVEVTTNRPDLLGTLGLAREASALSGQALRLPPADPPCGTDHVAALAAVEVLDAETCPRYTARLIRGVKVGPSPEWLRRRLEAVGIRCINNVVDVTNYVLFECGQPLHAFDFDKLRRRRIVVRRAVEGERMVAIDGTECRLDPSMLVIADGERPVAIAGIMGGLDTEISESTRDVLLESAQFDPRSIRHTSRALGLASDSSYRFERGVDPVQVEWASRRAARLIQEVAGGVVCQGVLDVWPRPYEPATVALRFSRMRKVLGTDIPDEAARAILERLGFEPLPEIEPDRLVVAVPPFRAADVGREIDLIEEVIRIYGYDRIPEKAALPIRVGQVTAFEKVQDAARRTLTALRFQEVVTNSFCDERSARLVSPWTEAEALAFQNTIRRHENRLRVSLMPGLLGVKRTNLARGVARGSLFEISRVFLPGGSAATLPERRVAGGATEGPPPDGSGKRPRGSSDRLPEERHVLALLVDEDMAELKGAVEELLARLGLLEEARFEPAEPGFFEEGRSGRVLLGGSLLAVLGQVAREVSRQYDLSRPVCMAEVDFDRLVRCARLERRFRRLPAYPAAVRDLSVVVDEAVTWARIQACIRDLRLPLLEEVVFFDVFRGGQVPRGKKSISFSLVFRSPERTLTSEEVEEARQRCIRALAEGVGARLRA